jgi:F-type H+-transporting ATPase subunit epsilon
MSEFKEKEFSLKIIAANRVFYDGPCESIIVPQYDGGGMQVLLNHENMATVLNAGTASFRRQGEEDREVVLGVGFIEVVDNVVTVLVESAETPEEIDVLRAQQAAKRATERLRERQSKREYNHTCAALARAMARLAATKKYR